VLAWLAAETWKLAALYRMLSGTTTAPAQAMAR